MLKLKKILLGLPVLVLALAIVTVTAYAHDETASSEEQKVSQSGRNDSEKTPEDEQPSRRADLDRAVHVNEDSFRKSGDDLLTQMKTERKEVRTTEQRKKACETRKQGLQTKLDNLNKNAQKHQGRIDEVFAKVVAYQKDKNLTIDNFDALVAAATAAQSKSQASVKALSNLKPTLDCNKDSVASDVAAFKAAAAQARSDLAAYKKTVKDLLTAAAAAKEQGA